MVPAPKMRQPRVEKSELTTLSSLSSLDFEPMYRSLLTCLPFIRRPKPSLNQSPSPVDFASSATTPLLSADNETNGFYRTNQSDAEHDALGKKGLRRLAKAIRTDFYKSGIIKGPLHPESRIVLLYELEEFWRRKDRKTLYESQPWYKDFKDNEPPTRILKILSILILIRNKMWESNLFAKKFGSSGKYSDASLPIEESVLVKELGTPDGIEFYKIQFMFCPLIIEERSKPYELSMAGGLLRFPFIDSGKEIGYGATSTVYEETIGARCLRYTQYSGLRRSEITEATKVAVKRVSKHRAMDVEFDNLADLRSSLCQHDRIMANIATVIEKRLGMEIYHIFYDLAAFTLDTLLEETVPNYRPRRHTSADTGRNNSLNYWAGDLINEAGNLAGALDFLHNHLRIDHKDTIACSHNDLRLQNILVFFPDSIEGEERFPVGQWKITDFGIAKIKRKRVSSHYTPTSLDAGTVPDSDLLSPHGRQIIRTDSTHRRRSTSLSNTDAKRPPGRFTAPEVKEKGKPQGDGRTGDVWSFGGILCEVLCHAVGTGSYVREFRKECKKEYPGYSFHIEATGQVKPNILRYLESLKGKMQDKLNNVHSTQSNDWIDECVKLIKIILQKEPDERPLSGKIAQTLKYIRQSMGNPDDYYNLGKSDSEQDNSKPTEDLFRPVGLGETRHRKSDASSLSQSPETYSHSRENSTPPIHPIHPTHPTITLDAPTSFGRGSFSSL